MQAYEDIGFPVGRVTVIFTNPIIKNPFSNREGIFV